jgi:molybdenum cofactor cytidylyltransferase
VRIAAIVLAAGESTRMGRPKALLPWGGASLLIWQIEQLKLAGVDDVVVVLGHEAEAVQAALGQSAARAVLNPDYRTGRASSLRAGAAAVRDTDAVLIVGVDQPRPAAVSLSLIERWRETRPVVVVPTHAGRRGHPVLVDGSLLAELRTATEEEMGLRGILVRHADKTLEVSSGPVVTVDLNTPADYQATVDRFHAGEYS